MGIIINQCIIRNNSFDWLLMKHPHKSTSVLRLLENRFLKNNILKGTIDCRCFSGLLLLNCGDAPSTMLFSCRLKIILLAVTPLSALADSTALYSYHTYSLW